MTVAMLLFCSMLFQFSFVHLSSNCFAGAALSRTFLVAQQECVCTPLCCGVGGEVLQSCFHTLHKLDELPQYVIA